MRLHLRRRSGGDGPAVVQRHDPVRDRRDQAHVVLDHQNGDAEQIAYVLDPEGHVVGLLDVEAGGRLVEQQQLGVGAERARQLRHLAHAVGQVDDEAVAVLLEVEELDDLLDRLAMLQLHAPDRGQEQQLGEESRSLVGMACQQQVLQQRRVLEQLDVLEGACDAERGDAVRRHVGDVGAVEDQLAAGRLVDAAHQVEDGGLAGAVRADDGEDLALLDGEAHAVDRLDAAEVDRQPVRLEEAHRRRSDRM